MISRLPLLLLITALLLLHLCPSPVSASSPPSPFHSLSRWLHLSSYAPANSDSDSPSVLSVPTTLSSAHGAPKSILHASPAASSPGSASSDAASDASPLSSTTVWVIALVLTLIGVILLFGTYLAVSM